MPVIYWTGTAKSLLPSMIRGDRLTVIVDKAEGATSFEQALAWALAPPVRREPEGSAVS